MRDRHGTAASYQLVFLTAARERNVLRKATGNRGLLLAAARLQVAIGNDATEFHASVGPDRVFWFAVAMLVLSVVTALVIAKPRRR